jgi:hypothetical protein
LLLDVAKRILTVVPDSVIIPGVGAIVTASEGRLLMIKRGHERGAGVVAGWPARDLAAPGCRAVPAGPLASPVTSHCPRATATMSHRGGQVRDDVTSLRLARGGLGAGASWRGKRECCGTPGA